MHGRRRSAAATVSPGRRRHANARSYVRRTIVRPSAETSPAVTASPSSSLIVPTRRSVVTRREDGRRAT